MLPIASFPAGSDSLYDNVPKQYITLLHGADISSLRLLYLGACH